MFFSLYMTLHGIYLYMKYAIKTVIIIEYNSITCYKKICLHNTKAITFLNYLCLMHPIPCRKKNEDLIYLSRLLENCIKENMYCQTSFHHDKQHGFVRSEEKCCITKIIFPTDGTIRCTTGGLSPPGTGPYLPMLLV